MRSTLKKDDFSSELPVGDAPTAVPTSPGAEASASHSAQLPLQASLRKDDFPSAGSATACRLPQRRLPPPRPAAVGSGGTDSRLTLQPANIQLALNSAPSSAGEAAARAATTETVTACLDQSLEPTTKKTYNSALAVNVGGAEVELGAELLPMDSDSKLMAAFARMDGKPWGSTRVLKAAVRAWHETREAQDVLAASWTPRALRFWRGLKKRADHTKSHAKKPVSLDEFDSYVQGRLARGSAAGLPDAAAAGVCFFGVRRSAEMLAMREEHLSWLGAANNPTGAACRVLKQKNDPDGHGMTCWIPAMPQRGDLCPVRLLRRWWLLRRTTWPEQGGMLFCVTGKREVRAQSYDSWRKSVATHFASSSVGTHSLRKGGAHWFRTQTDVPEDALQAQGGWADPETMRAIYAALTEEERRAAILRAGLSAPSRAGAPALPLAESRSRAKRSHEEMDADTTSTASAPEVCGCGVCYVCLKNGPLSTGVGETETRS